MQNNLVVKNAIMITLVVMLLIVLSTSVCSAQEMPSDSDTWTKIDVNVINNIDDTTFTIKGEYFINMQKGAFDVRIVTADIQDKIHYFNISGYTLSGFDGWTESGNYIVKTLKSVTKVDLLAQYTANTLTVIFMDGHKGSEITRYNVSLNASVKAPVPTDYTADGYVFVGWQGGDYENVISNMTVYSVYAPARYVKVTMPDGNTTTIAVAKGSKVSDITPPAFGKKKFKDWHNANDESIDNNYVINEDIELKAVYGAFTMPQWAKTTLIVVGCLAASAVIIFITMKFITKK